MIAAIYAHKSTDQNGVSDEGKSITRQVQHAKAYAERKGWECARYSRTMASRARSSSTGPDSLKPRPKFQVLVMSEESRLGREQIETAYLVKQIIDAGVRIFFYLEDRERTLGNRTDKLLLAVSGFAAEVGATRHASAPMSRFKAQPFR